MLSFTLLNQAKILKDNTPLSQFRSQKEAALLIYLAHMGETHPREFIAELLWESSTTKQSLTNLRTALARLKKQVGEDVLIITRKTIGIAPNKIDRVDSTHLLETISATSAIDTAEKAKKLQTALEAYQGEFLANFSVTKAGQFNQWVIFTREEIRRQIDAAYEKLAQFAIATEDHEYGLAIADRWLSVDRLNESAHSLRIRLLVATDKGREAVSEYHNFTDLLQAELGVEPPESLSDLVREIQPPPTDINRAKRGARHNLPPTYDQFFGRQNDRQEIHTRLDQPWCRLVTLVGQGGTGKTRFATTLARSRLGQYRDGVWFIELANLDSEDDDLAETIAVEIAIGLDLRLSGSDTPIEQLLNHLQYKQMLLVLDNFEHVLIGKQLVLNIIQRCEQVQILATSREALRLRPEWAFPLSGLTYPTNGDEDEPATAVQLFVARRAQQQWDELDADELTAVRKICRIVEGLPLAIELAAALTRYDSCQEIAERLKDGFDALKATLDDVPDRHRGLYTVFEMSWQTLTPTLQQRLTRLAYFRGGFDKTAVSQIADTTPQHLTALAEKSLLTFNRTNKRYRLHPVIQAYAEELRAPFDKTPQKHADYFLNLLAEHSQPLQKDKPQDSMALLEPDLENIRLAWQTGLETEQADKLLNGLTSLSIIYQLRGWALEGETVMRTTVETAVLWEEPSLSLATRAGLEQARFQNRLGRYHPAIQTLKISLSRAEKINDQWAEGMAYVWWGESLWRLGKYELAKDKINLALAIANNIGDSLIYAWGHHQLGVIFDIQSKFDLALKHIEKACFTWEELNNTQALSGSLNSRGIIFHNLGDSSNAKSSLERALELCDQFSDRFRKSHLINNLSLLATKQEDFSGAIYYLTLGLQLASEIGNQRMVGTIHANLARNYNFLGEYSSAEKHVEQGIRISKATGDQQSYIEGMLALAKTKQHLAEFIEVQSILQEVLEICKAQNLKGFELETLLFLIEIIAKYDKSEAKGLYNDAKLLANELPNPDLLERTISIKALLN
ncbi:MAG: tetratricopeptide repeat protein [Chloroflexota bacterium]